MSKSKASHTSRSRPASQPRSARSSSAEQSAPPTVSGRWLLASLAVALFAAVFCAWGALCILFWQGSWQLLYHPTSAVTKTPANVNLPFESIGFATNASGEPQLRGWWIFGASQRRFTALYLHSQTGNLSDTIPDLIRFRDAGLNIFTFDYRGYGQSHLEHPSEKRWREDAESALRYLTQTRHIPATSIILIGRDLGANLALEVGAAHPDLAGTVLEQPLPSPTTEIFSDARSRMVPARMLVSDRWDTNGAASNLLIPSLWFIWAAAQNTSTLQAYQDVTARKSMVWLASSPREPRQFDDALFAFIDQLQRPAK